MSGEWGQSFKQLRMSTGLKQGEFSETLSRQWLQLSDSDRQSLNEIGVDYLDLSSTDVSRYEKGRRMPRNRSRYTSLIFSLYKLESIQTIDEANEWLQLADQGPLTTQEQAAIFDSIELNLGKGKPFGEVQNTEVQLEPTDKLIAQTVVDTKPARTQAALASSETVVTSIPLPASTDVPDENYKNSWPSRKISSIVALLAVLIAAILLGAMGMALWGERGNGKQELTAEVVQDSSSLAAAAIPRVDPDNLVLNGDFSNGMEGWVKYEDTLASALELYVEDEALCANIIDSGLDVAFPQIVYNEIDELLAQTEYVLSFNVTVSLPRALGIEIPNSAYVSRELTKGSQSIETTFFQDNDDYDPKIAFRVGRDGPGTICFDNIALKLKRKETTSLPATPIVEAVPDNLIHNGTFDDGMQKWWFYTSPDNELALNVKNGELCSEILSSPQNRYELQFGHHMLSESDGDSPQVLEYLLSFDVTKSNTVSQVWIGIGWHSDLLQQFDLGLGPQKFENIKWTLNIDDNLRPSLIFNLGEQEKGSIICIDNVVLLPVDPVE